MRISKKLISILLAVLMAVSMMPFSAITAFAIADKTGSWGKNSGTNVTYTLTDTNGDGTHDKLIFTGSGEMMNIFTYHNTPWGPTNNGGNGSYRNITEVVVGEGITSLGQNACCCFSSLTKVTLPSTLTTICQEAFPSCKKLSAIALPSNLTTIGDYAFYDCPALENVTIPAKVTSIGKNAFEDCTLLSTVTFERPSAEQNLSLGSNAFKNSPATVAYTGSGADLYDGETLVEENATLSTFNNKTLNWVVPAVTGVAQIGETVYETLEEAIAAAQNGDTIKLLDDVTGNFTIPAGKNVSLDLNGHTITATNTSTPVITNRGTLNVYGGTIVNNGLYFPGVLGDGGVAVMNYGVATVNVTTNKGAIVNRSTASTTPNLTIAGGTYAGNPLALSSENNSYTVINGGDFITGEAAFVTAKSGATTEVNGGNFACLGTDSESNWIVNGGNVNAITVDENTSDISITVNGGEIKSLPSTSIVNNSTNVSVEVSGGSFDSVVPTEYCADGYVPVTEPDADGKYTVKTDTATIDEISITTADEIDVNLYLGDTGKEATVEYTFNTTPDIQEDTQDTVTVDFDSLPEVAGKRKLTITVAPAQIQDNITIIVKDAGGSKLRSYEHASVAIYCRLLVLGDYSENIKTLAKSVLDYGKAASAFFGYNTGAYESQEYVNSGAFDFSGISMTAGKSGDINIDSVRYVAKSVPDLRFEVGYTEEEAAGLTATTDKGYAASFVKDANNTVLLQVTGIPAAKLNEKIRIDISNGAVIEYTPLAYAKLAAQSSNVELAKLGNSIGYYWQAAYAVFA